VSRDIVFDASGLIAYFEKSPRAMRVVILLKEVREGKRRAFMSVVNWGEVYYVLVRKAGRDAAERALAFLDQLPVIVADADRPLARQAAEFKAARKLSYADSFAAALAVRRNAALVAADREFDRVRNQVEVIRV